LDKYLLKHITLRYVHLLKANGFLAFNSAALKYSVPTCTFFMVPHISSQQLKKNGVDGEYSVIDVVNCYTVESNPDSSNVGVLEIARASAPVSPVSLIPEKVGQVVAAMHFLLLSKMVRNKCKCLSCIVKTKGILLEKCNGAIECVNAPISPLITIQIRDFVH